MHKHILGAAAAAFLVASLAGCAGTETKGTVQNVNPAQQEVTLSDGKTYKAADGVDLASLQTGDNVTIQTKEENGQTVITKITKS